MQVDIAVLAAPFIFAMLLLQLRAQQPEIFTTTKFFLDLVVIGLVYMAYTDGSRHKLRSYQGQGPTP